MNQSNPPKDTVLIADDSEMNRSILADMLGEDFSVLEAGDGCQAMEILEKEQVSLLFLDTAMPHMDGFAVLEAMNQRHWREEIPVIMIIQENMTHLIEQAYSQGVAEIVVRPFDAYIVRQRARNTIMLYANQRKLALMAKEQVSARERHNNLMIQIFSTIVEFRNGESYLHVPHIRVLTALLLKQLHMKTRRYALTDASIDLIASAAALHDIGKIAIPDGILRKPGPLTPDELSVIQTHPERGAELLRHIPLSSDVPLIKAAYDICRWHHERYDGTGYPDGLRGDQIPISAQAVGMADAYDSLTRVRVYKGAYSHARAVDMILNGECGTFNPLLLECLSEIRDRIEDEFRSNAEQPFPVLSLSETAQGELTVSERTFRLLENERTKYQFFASLSKEIQFELSPFLDIITISEAGAQRLGIPTVLMSPLSNPELKKVIDEGAIHELGALIRASTVESPVIQHTCILRIDGQPRWTRLILRTIWSDEKTPKCQGVIGKAVDIHEEHSRMEALERLASHDALTGLLNQAAVRQRIRDLLAEEVGDFHALLIIDLDHFKDANDRFGHLFGDDVLKFLAASIRKNIRSSDLAARVGGDEFLVFMKYTTDIHPLIQRIFHSLEGSYEGFEIRISMGIALAPQDAHNYEDLFYCADRALYTAKRTGRQGYRFYDASMAHTFSALSPIDSDQQENQN